jgi:toxin ParE1/3/4
MLAGHPEAGPAREDLAPGLRFFPVGNYLVFYTQRAGGISVARVLHGVRDYRYEIK